MGKRAAIAEANKPIRKTLRPCKTESKNWDTTENLYIEGDNLEVLKLLQESYLGKVKMIYIDILNDLGWNTSKIKKNEIQIEDLPSLMYIKYKLNGSEEYHHYKHLL